VKRKPDAGEFSIGETVRKLLMLINHIPKLIGESGWENFANGPLVMMGGRQVSPLFSRFVLVK
jgi:hypothetical protein